MMSLLVPCVVVLLGGSSAFGQTDSVPKRPSLARRLWDDFIQPLPPPDTSDAGDSRVNLMPLPVITYSPETSLSLGATALLTLNLFDNARPTFAEFSTEYSLKGQTLAFAEVRGFLPNEWLYVEGNFKYRFFPENYYGIGPRADPETVINYDNTRMNAEAIALVNVSESAKIFLGPHYLFERIWNIEAPGGSFFERGQVPGGEGYRVHGLGYQFRWDRRDNPFNPKTGHFILLDQMSFAPALGNTRHFIRTEWDVRKYVAFGCEDRMSLAFRLYALLNIGRPPFRQLAMMGNDDILRGFYNGRFRDNHFAGGTVEYRTPLFWRLGMVLFSSVGDVARTIGGFQADRFKFTYGAGARFMIDRRNRANIRADFGINSEGGTGFYLRFGESF